METATFDAFWSYAHEDNDRGGGRVLALASALKDEFAVTTGDELQVFVDRADIAWGDLWRSRITGAIGEVPFFIPIITPKYIRSPECRRELIQFYGQAGSHGLQRLLLPILFIDVPDLTENSDDEVLAIIARTQYVNWTKLRLLPANDHKILQGVNELALRIQELREETSQIVLKSEPVSVDDSEAQMRATLAQIEERLPTWMEAVDFDKVAGRFWRGALDARLERVDRLLASHAANGAILSTYMQLGRELLPIAADRLEKAQNYARLTIELDPFVNAALRQIALHPARAHELNELRDGVNEAYLNIEPPAGVPNGYGLPDWLAAKTQHLGEASRTVAESHKYVREGNAIVLEWREKFMSLDAPAVVPIR